MNGHWEDDERLYLAYCVCVAFVFAGASQLFCVRLYHSPFIFFFPFLPVPSSNAIHGIVTGVSEV